MAILKIMGHSVVHNLTLLVLYFSLRMRLSYSVVSRMNATSSMHFTHAAAPGGGTVPPQGVAAKTGSMEGTKKINVQKVTNEFPKFLELNMTLLL